MAGDEGSLGYGDRVCFDSIDGVAGIEWPVGTPQLPSDVIADVITMLAARRLHKICIHGTLTLAATMNHYSFFGHEHEAAGDILNLGGQDVDDSHFESLIITGVQGGAGLATYRDCLFVSTLPIPMTGFRGMAKNCAFFSGLGIAIATGNTDFADFDHCTSIHGVATVIIGSPDRVSFKEFSGGLILTLQAAGDVLVRGISGYLEIDEMTGGTLEIYAHGADIQINADCVGGTIAIYGDARVTDLSAGGCVVTDSTKETQLDDIETKLDAGGLGSGKVTKALTFANNNGQVNLFTVTGDVIVRIIAVVKTNCATGTACNVSVGTAALVDAIIPVTDITTLAAQEIWHDATPDSEIEALGTMREYIVSDGNDITLNSSAGDNSGAITFYCFWTALSSGATVVAA